MILYGYYLHATNKQNSPFDIFIFGVNVRQTLSLTTARMFWWQSLQWEITCISMFYVTKLPPANNVANISTYMKCTSLSFLFMILIVEMITLIIARILYCGYGYGLVTIMEWYLVYQCSCFIACRHCIHVGQSFHTFSAHKLIGKEYLIGVGIYQN